MPAREKSPNSIRVPNGRGDSLAVRVWEPEGQPNGGVLIVHGLGEHSGRYDFVARSLVREGFLVHAHDQIGHGETDGRRGDVGSFDWLLDDIELLVEQLDQQGSQFPVFLYGHSLGGGLVLNFAIRRASRIVGAIATSPLLVPATGVPAWKTTLGRFLKTVWPTFSFATGVDPSELSHDPVAVKAYVDDPLVHGSVSARLAMEMFAAGEWTLNHASELALPVLLMHGTADRVTCCDASEKFAQRAGDVCTLKTWPGLFHELHQESEKDEVLATVCQWMHQRLRSLNLH